MRKYKLLRKNIQFEATDDKVAAVAVATVGDYGFTDRDDYSRFPAAWSEQEFKWYLEHPLKTFTAQNQDDINTAIESIRTSLNNDRTH